MAKNKVTEYSTTPADNTDVGGINVAEGCDPSDVNDAKREGMAHLARVNAGTDPLHDTVTFADPVDETKRIRFDAGSVAAGETRVLTMPDADVTMVADPLSASTGVAADSTLLGGTSKADVLSRTNHTGTLPDTALSAKVVRALSNENQSDALWFRSSANGAHAIIGANYVTHRWDSGFYYNVDSNAYVLINSSPSDERFKIHVDYQGDIFDEILEVEARRFTPKDKLPVAIPQGLQDGFFAQELVNLAGNLVVNVPIPQVLDKDGKPRTDLLQTDDGMYWRLADNAPIQLISKLWRAVSKLIEETRRTTDVATDVDEAQEPTLDDIKYEAVRRMNGEHARFLRKLSEQGSTENAATRTMKALSAHAFLMGSPTEAQSVLLQSQVDITGETVSELAGKIALRDKAYHKLVGMADGHKIVTIKAIRAATSPEQVHAALMSAAAKADELAAQWVKETSA